MGDALRRLAEDAHAKAAEISQRSKPIDTCPECGKPIEPTRQALIDEFATHGYRMVEREGQAGMGCGANGEWIVTPCHHLDGVFWCDRKAGHRKPHRFVLRPDVDLHKTIFEVWNVVHPNSRGLMGWVIPAEVCRRFEDEAREQQSRAGMYLFRADDPPTPPMPAMLLGRPVREGGRSICVEVVRRS